jgi:hypothetical protein
MLVIEAELSDDRLPPATTTRITARTWTMSTSIRFKHGLVAAPVEWPYSTFRACVRRGLYPLDWIGSGLQDLSAGEPGRQKHSSEYA